jgi:cyclopropane fatty-acyl-phospholipid synthase-like methyltransferase
MGVPDEVFDDDYGYFYAGITTDERSDAEAERIARMLSLEPGVRVLDVPCGEGRIAGRLTERGCEVVGVDRSDLFVGIGQQRHPAVDFRRGDMCELDYDQAASCCWTCTTRTDCAGWWRWVVASSLESASAART